MFDNSKTLNYGIDYAVSLGYELLIWFIRNFASCDGEYNGNGQYNGSCPARQNRGSPARGLNGIIVNYIPP